MMATDERPLEEEVVKLARDLRAIADRLVATVERIESADDDEETPPDDPERRPQPPADGG